MTEEERKAKNEYDRKYYKAFREEMLAKRRAKYAEKKGGNVRAYIHRDTK